MNSVFGTQEGSGRRRHDGNRSQRPTEARLAVRVVDTAVTRRDQSQQHPPRHRRRQRAIPPHPPAHPPTPRAGRDILRQILLLRERHSVLFQCRHRTGRRLLPAVRRRGSRRGPLGRSPRRGVVPHDLEGRLRSFLVLEDHRSRHGELAAIPLIPLPDGVVGRRLQEGRAAPGVFHGDLHHGGGAVFAPRDGGEDVRLVGGAVGRDDDAGVVGEEGLFAVRVEVVVVAGDGDGHVGGEGEEASVDVGEGGGAAFGDYVRGRRGEGGERGGAAAGEGGVVAQEEEEE
mmetsp:Transcript_25756/g.53219  ORF Transcript_25756/g.53219 Transcript_25756/m.53219 type:complete len:286 (-) Transcript_25756:177-1034(-)